MKHLGCIVFETSDCGDIEQALALDKSDGKPEGGILDWRDNQPAVVFLDRKAAKAAIARTEHYRLAFATNHPEAKYCKIVPIIPA